MKGGLIKATTLDNSWERAPGPSPQLNWHCLLAWLAKWSILGWHRNDDHWDGIENWLLKFISAATSDLFFLKATKEGI